MLVMLVILYDFHEMLTLKKKRKKHNIFDTYVLKSNSYNLRCL